jgi:hypothetical protein
MNWGGGCAARAWATTRDSRHSVDRSTGPGPRRSPEQRRGHDYYNVDLVVGGGEVGFPPWRSSGSSQRPQRAPE